MEHVFGSVLPWAEQRLGRLPRVAFGVSNGAVWAAAAGALHPRELAGVVAFSLGVSPPLRLGRRPPPHALAAGTLEPGFSRATTAYAWTLRARGVRVRLRRPVRGHDHTMWEDELVPALRWLLRRMLVR
jgi:enterochelin esterase-like enzyme